MLINTDLQNKLYCAVAVRIHDKVYQDTRIAFTLNFNFETVWDKGFNDLYLRRGWPGALMLRGDLC